MLVTVLFGSNIFRGRQQISNLEYPACIDGLYQSEVLGEQAFLALIAVARNEREKYHFGTLLQLESETKVRLRPFLQTYSLEFVESLGGSAQVTGFVAAYKRIAGLNFQRRSNR